MANSRRGAILIHAGAHIEHFLPAVRALLPDEEVVAWPGAVTEQPEILATLAFEDMDVESAMLPSVRWIHVLTTGVDHFPVHALGDRVLTASKGASAIPIAEYVVAMMLAFEKRLPELWVSEPPAAWMVPPGRPLGGLHDATLALLGVGSVGTEVARRALAFGMRVVAYRRSDAPMPLPEVERAASVAEALGEADHIVVCAPATPATYHLVDEDALQSVKPGAHLVNVARGSLVDTEALLRALDDGRLARASLDVAEVEPTPAGHPFYSHPRVRFTPHLSHSSRLVAKRTVDLFVDNVRRWRAGLPLTGLVDPTAGY